jgi:hypothetical protein
MALPALAMAGIGAGLGALGGLLGRDKNQSTVGYDAGTNRSQSSFTPAAAAAPLYGYMAGIGQQMGSTPTPYFPGMGYVGPSGPTQQGVGMGMGAMPYYGMAANQALGAQPYMEQALRAAGNNYGLLSSAADVANNPYVQQMMQTNRSRIGEALQEDWLPALDLGFARGGAGSVGSSRHGLGQSESVQNAAKELGRANSELMLGAYGQGLGAQQSALGQTGNMLQNLMAPSAASAAAAGYYGQGGQVGLGYGQTVEGYQQQALQDAMARYGYQYEEPWMRANNIQGAMGALAPIGMNNTSGATTGASSGTNPNYQSPFGAMAQGAIGGGFMGYGLGTPGSRFMGAMGAAPGTSGGLYGPGGFYDQTYR